MEDGKALAVVQVEFFLAGDGSFDGFIQDLLRRREESSRVNLVIRFYDNDVSLKRLIIKYAHISKLHQRYRDQFFMAPKIWSSYYSWQSGRMLRKSLRIKESVRVKVLESLEDLVRRKGDIVIEESDWSFRLVNENEYHELFESAKVSKDFWVFLFSSQRNLIFERAALTH